MIKLVNCNNKRNLLPKGCLCVIIRIACGVESVTIVLLSKREHGVHCQIICCLRIFHWRTKNICHLSTIRNVTLQDKLPQKHYNKILYSLSLFGQDGWILALFFYCEFVDLDSVSFHKAAKKRTWPIYIQTS